MMLASVTTAYQIQKKILLGKVIGCYKVGASNYSSGKFFGTDEIIVGGIESKNIFFSKIRKDYSIAELELVVKIRVSNDIECGYEILNQYLGIECPIIEVDNPHGDMTLCIADNCSSGDLIILDEYDGDYDEKLAIFVNDVEVTKGDFDSLRFPVKKIICKTLSIIENNSLPLGKEIYIATGGLTATFPLNNKDQLRVHFE